MSLSLSFSLSLSLSLSLEFSILAIRIIGTFFAVVESTRIMGESRVNENMNYFRYRNNLNLKLRRFNPDKDSLFPSA